MNVKTDERRILAFVRGALAAGLIQELEERALARHGKWRGELAGQLLDICATRSSALATPSAKVAAARAEAAAAAQAYRAAFSRLNQAEMELMGVASTNDAQESASAPT